MMKGKGGAMIEGTKGVKKGRRVKNDGDIIKGKDG